MSDTFCHVKNRPCYRDDCEPGKFCAMYDKPVTNIAADPIAAEARGIADCLVNELDERTLIRTAQAIAAFGHRMKSAGRDEASAWHIGDEVTLSSCSPGLFLFNGTLGFKTEYDTIGLNGHPLNSPEAYVVASGEYFWGDTSDRGKRDELLVRDLLSTNGVFINGKKIVEGVLKAGETLRVGEVQLRFERVGAADIDALRMRLAQQRTPLALFGGGHVGQALVRVLAPLPLQLRWIDSRDQIFPTDLPHHVVTEHSDPVQACVSELVPASRVLIMSFSHAEDLEVVAACLTRQRQRADLPYVGLIGSKTKWASFSQRLLARGFTAQELSHVTCPIGVDGIFGKEPEVIAVAVAAQILQTLQQG